jgi:hypothetical protein
MLEEKKVCATMLYRSNNQSQSNTTFEHGKVFRNDARRQAAMERAGKKENRRTQHQI